MLPLTSLLRCGGLSPPSSTCCLDHRRPAPCIANYRPASPSRGGGLPDQQATCLALRVSLRWWRSKFVSRGAPRGNRNLANSIPRNRSTTELKAHDAAPQHGNQVPFAANFSATYLVCKAESFTATTHLSLTNGTTVRAVRLFRLTTPQTSGHDSSFHVCGKLLTSLRATTEYLLRL